LAFALATGTPAVGQVGSPTDRSITGIVSDSVSGRALGAVTLYLDGSRDEYRTAANGRFSLPGAPPGDLVLVVRRIGYVPARVFVAASVSASVIDVGTVLLRPVATELDRIAVETEEVRVQPHLSDFYRRKQQGMPGGTFITRDDIALTGAIASSEVLRRVAKVEMACHNNRALGDDNCSARNRRGRDIRLVGGSGWTFDRCEMEIWVDGGRSTLRVDEIPVDLIAAVEVYGGTSTTPTAFGQGRCGVIAFWLRRT
jgi:hypothetical protein